MGISTRLGWLLFLLLVNLVPLKGRGQQQELSIVYLLADAPVAPATEKMALAQLEVLDPDFRLSLQADRQRLKLGKRGPMDVAAAVAALAAVGIPTTVVAGPAPTASQQKSAQGTTTTFPQFVDTGNPILDDQNYQAAKAAWVQSNQQLYLQMIGAATDH